MLELGKFQYKACVGLMSANSYVCRGGFVISIQGLCRFNII